MVKLGLWRTGHCPSLFPLVSTPLIPPGSDGRKGSVSWSAPASLQKNRPAKISSITSALRGIPGMNLVVRRCGKCRGKAAIECPGCKGTGKNKKNGNMFERWKCYDCEGFGLLSCPSCGKGRAHTCTKRIMMSLSNYEFIILVVMFMAVLNIVF